ncbi:MAG: hypothetical protein M1309_06810 [Actinobacteria bacterium]|nr:hypothetical protein [Actinomycetota bacterium]
MNPKATLLLALPVVVLAAALVAWGCGGSYVTPPVETNTQSLGTLTGRITRPGRVTKDDVQQVIDHELGTKGVMQEPLVRNITLTPAAGGTSIDIDMNRTECPMIAMEMVCTPEQLPGVAADATQKVASILFEYKDVSRVQINLYSDLQTSVNMTGSMNMDQPLVVKTVITRAAAVKMDWSAYSEDTAAKMASDYWVNPAIPANSSASPSAGGASTGTSTGGGMQGMPGM